MINVKQERQGTRDLSLSLRHRLWGPEFPAVDMDYPLIEYDHCKVTALVEYKNEHANPENTSGSTYRALADLGTRAGVPVFVCFYASDFSYWRAIPLNARAMEYLPDTMIMTEAEWAALLFRTKGRGEMPDDIRSMIENLPGGECR